MKRYIELQVADALRKWADAVQSGQYRARTLKSMIYRDTQRSGPRELTINLPDNLFDRASPDD